MVPGATSAPSGRSWWNWVLAGLAGAVLAYLLVVVFPRFSLLWGYSGIKAILYEDLSLSDAWSSFFALIGSFLYAILWLPMLWWTLSVVVWRFNLRKAVLALGSLIIVYGHAPLARALFASEPCFNQRTGEPLKWYVIRSGQVILFDSAGYDPASRLEKLPVSARICQIVSAQRQGIRPRQISDDPRNVKFFDEVTGQPRVWYHQARDGQIDFFDAEGTHPTVGEPLMPVTKDIVQLSHAIAVSKQAATERATQLRQDQDRQRALEEERVAKLELERKLAHDIQKARSDLIDLFGTASYANGVVIIGATSGQNDELSVVATRHVLNNLSTSLRNNGLQVDEFRPQVYSAGHFDRVFSGNGRVLTDVGLTEKMRAALLAVVDTRCNPASEMSGVVSCTLSVRVRLFKPTGHGTLAERSQTGAGSSVQQAIARAAELLWERYPELLKGI